MCLVIISWLNHAAQKLEASMHNWVISNLGTYLGIFIDERMNLLSEHLFQSISMAIQKSNTVCVMGCPKDNFSGLDGLFNFQVHEAEEL